MYLKMLAGKSQPIPFDPKETIGMFKQKVYQLTGLPVKEQKLICGGMVLSDDNKTFEEYGIYDDSSLFLLPILAGGQEFQPSHRSPQA